MVKFKSKYVEEIEKTGDTSEYKYCIYLFEQYATDEGKGSSIFYADSIADIREILKTVKVREKGNL